MDRFEVIYLTGAPATGKTTLVKRLVGALPKVRAFVYSEMLAEHISRRDRNSFSQRKLRQHSATAVTPKDIQIVDDRLIQEVRKARKQRHVLIDSHPVTKERFGFRVTAFSVRLLKALRPSRIYMLYADSATVIKRITDHSKGRPMVSEFEADFHCLAQAAVAITYGIQLGIPVYFYDSSRGTTTAFDEISKRFNLT